MNNYFLVICRPNEANTIITHDYDSKSVSEIRSINKVKDNEFIAIHTPLYQKPLSEQSYPVKMYPDLIQTSRPDKFLRPNYFLEIVSCNSESLTLYIKVDCQKELHLPPF